MITVEDIGTTPSEEGHCKTRRTKWLSKMGSGEYIKESEWQLCNNRKGGSK
ncbi:MAG: hypothetical protein QM528_05785 [Phycisphaerales bacterium]|nr:hypothetical protein [Phycisphaerales bacterium]